jgi:UDP-N-acetylmuramyl pentapeptide phosphotransferase/UDP-N-acetylglucosamine-1-phosphate transferase
MLFLLLGFAASSFITLLVVRSAHTHSHLSADSDMSAPQRFHSSPVPRVGGLGIVLGLALVLGLLWKRGGDATWTGLTLVGCALPAFLAGLAEDITKRQSPRRRLFFTAVSAGLALWALDASIARTDIPGLDWLVSFGVGAAIVTVFAVAGVANAVNIIDGFNGLAAMCVVMMLGAIAYVAYQAGDPVIATCALAGLGAVMGFFVWNFPAGLIFLGDGGAYFLGFFVAELGILLLQRNPDVSPMFPLLLCIYPIFETLFSMYRRKFLRGRPMVAPDGVHLHSLVYRRLVRWAAGRRGTRTATMRNSMTAPYLWTLCMFSIVPAMVYWDNTAALASFIVMFGMAYIFIYGRIVRFKVPEWLIVRH